MLVGGKNCRTVWFGQNALKLVNQTLLPFKFETFESKNFKQTAFAIKSMIVRGAPAIGATGAYGLAQAALECNETDLNKFFAFISTAKKILAGTRPTAFDLFHALNFVESEIKKSGAVESAKHAALIASQNYADSSAKNCEKIGIFGNSLISKNSKILTHCNAGWLAAVDWGTALSPIYKAKRNGKKPLVFVDETRPRLQGAQLTAWELSQEKISHSIIADNSAGYFMSKGEIDLCLVGADRIASNGDVANKIGTFEKAVLAKENNIPFYVAAPSTTFDLNCESGKNIPIEERNENEILFVNGLNEKNELKKIRIASPNSSAKNPAFDVTPSKYISGIITEKRIIMAKESEIKKLFR